MKKPKDIDKYIKDFPKEAQTVLKQIRATIRKASPKAVEVISYGIPAFKLNEKGLIYFAGYKNHIGLYPAPRGKEEFKILNSISDEILNDLPEEGMGISQKSRG